MLWFWLPDILCGVQKVISALPKKTAEEVQQEAIRTPRAIWVVWKGRPFGPGKPMRSLQSLLLTTAMWPWYWLLPAILARLLPFWRTKPTERWRRTLLSLWSAWPFFSWRKPHAQQNIWWVSTSHELSRHCLHIGLCMCCTPGYNGHLQCCVTFHQDAE